MSYQPFLVADFATGLDKEVQPWLLPNDAFTELFDGFVYRGVAQIRNGYSGYATGFKSIACESRMVHNIADDPMTGAIDGANKTFTASLTPPVRRGTVVVTGSNPPQTANDDGVGGFTGDVDTALSSINYDTGAVTIVWNAAPIALSTVLITYDYHPGNPVMGVMTFYPEDNVAEMIVADTKYVNKYVPATDRLIDISPASTYGGDSTDFWGWVNYAAADSTPRLLFCNGVVGDVIQQWDGTTVTDYVFTPAGTFTTLNARQIFEVQDRLVCFQTIEDGVLYPRRIRISGFGANTDNFSDAAPGAGFIDIPDNSWFYGADSNRNDIIIFTETSVWIMKYTGNDVVPFQLFKIDGSRGSKAAFSAISYLNRTIAISPRGLIEVDGYNVERMDNNLPDFSFNEIQDGQFEHVFCGFLDEERDVYMMYPSTSWEADSLVPSGSSDRILVINFEEDNFCQYRLPLSCMGSFKVTDVVTWNDLTEANGFPNWDALSAVYGSWNAFPFNIGAPIGIGGGHKGEVWELNTDESEDNILRIRDIAFVNGPNAGSVLTVTTDWNNYKIGDMIFFDAVDGITGLNKTQVRIASIDTDYQTFVTQETQIPLSGAYVADTGYTSRVIPFSAKKKTLNPFINMDKKLKIGWIYVYVETTETWLEDSEGNQLPAILKLDVFTDDKQDPNNTNPNFSYEIDCTNPSPDQGTKKWIKIWINQVGKFIQLKFSNEQAGANMKIQAFMPGMAAIGRLV